MTLDAIRIEAGTAETLLSGSVLLDESRGRDSGIAPNQRPCLGCREPLVKRDNEASTTFLRRKYCSHKCFRHLQRPPALKTGSLHDLLDLRTDWTGVVFEDDPRAVRDVGWPLLLSQLRPKSEWAREV